MFKINLKRVLSLLFFLIVSVYYGNIAVMFVAVLFMLFGAIFSNTCFKSNKEHSFEIFLLFFLIYSLYAFIINEVYIGNGYDDYFIAIDSSKFFSNTENLLRFKSYFTSINSIEGNYLLTETRGFYYISVTIGYLANLIQANSYYIQLMVITFLSSLLITIIYNLLKLYLDHKDSYLFAILYGFFSFTFAYSANILRDIHICVLFGFGFYYFLKYKSLSNVFRLAVIFILLSLFRPEHAAFFGLVILLYLYIVIFHSNLTLTRKLAWSVLAAVCLVIIIFRFNVFYIIDLFNSTSQRYTELNNEDASQDGLGTALLNLPPGIKHIARASYSQILPFPITSGLTTSRGIVKLLAFPVMLAGVFWFLVWIVNFANLKNFKTFKMDYRYLLMLSLMFLIFASAASGDFRRLMAVYPLIYLFSVVSFIGLNKSNRYKVLAGGSLLYIGLHVVYISLKFL